MRSATRKGIGKDPAYCQWIRSQPCLLCPPGEQQSRTECAHVGNRGLSQKCPDRETAPLCREHHREGRESAHKMQKGFWGFHGLDRDDVIARLVSRYEGET